MSGVGWAQACGMMFLGSWVLNKFLIIFATLNQSFFTISSSGRISWPGYEHTTRSPKCHQGKRYLDLGEKDLGMPALVMHVVVVNNIFRIISQLQLTGWSSPLITVEILDYTPYIGPGYVLTVSAAVWVPAALMILIFRLQPNAASSILGLFFIMLGNLGANSVAIVHTSNRSYSSSVHVWAIPTVMILILVLVIRFLSQRFIMRGRNLLVLYRDGTEGQFSIDYRAFLAFIFFLSTIGASLFWYWKIYNPDGTSVPVWTGVFG
jgi:hypothetical protein